MRWPDRDPYDGGWSEFWPTWQQFWDASLDLSGPVAEPAPMGEFLTRMRGTASEDVKVRVR